MGLSPFSKDSYPSERTSIFSKWKENEKTVNHAENIVNLPNPKPDNYKILKSFEVNNWLLIEIKYLDCINYEGNKILLYKNCNLEKLKKQKLIDPHFSENKQYYSPFAKFEPTIDGWNTALKLMK